MFKNATLYRIVNLPAHFGTGAAELCFSTFEPCGATQEKSVGWVPPRGQANGALLESVAGQWIMALKTETKSVPKEAIDKAVAEQLAHIEATTGRKPGKKEKREIKDDARLALLPMAFPKARTTKLWINRGTGILMIDSASQSQLDDIITQLIKAVDGLVLQLIHTATAPSSAMAMWLSTKEAPTRFTVDRECELKASDESKAVVKYGRHALDIDEVAQHIAQGKVPTKLAMTFDGRVSFLLTEGGALKKIAFLDSVFEGGKDSEGDAFDADVTILAGEFQPLIKDLIAALGGEIQH